MSYLLVFASNATLSLLVVRLVRRWFAGDPLWLRALAVLMAFVGIGSMATLGLGLLGGLDHPWIVPALLLGALAMTYPHSPRTLAVETSGGEVEPAAWARTMVVAALALVCGYWLMRLAIGPPNISYDDPQYHAAIPARWLIAGRIYTVPIWAGYYPLNGELLSLWFMLPLRSDALVGFAPLLQAAILGLAAYGAQRLAGCSRWSAALAPTILLSSPVVLFAGVTFAGIDVATAGWIIAAVVLLASADRPGGIHRPSCVWAVLGAAYAAGIKVSIAHFAVLVAVAGLWKLWRASGSNGRFAMHAAALGLAMAGPGYWYLRNLILTANPIFPAALGPLSGPAGNLRATTAFAFLRRTPETDAWLQVGRTLLSWPYVYALLSGLGFLLAWLIFLRRRGAALGSAGQWLLILGSIAAVQFPFMPFSAGTPNAAAGRFHPLGARYLVLVFAVGLVLLGIAAARRLSSPRAMGILYGLTSCFTAGVFLWLLLEPSESRAGAPGPRPWWNTPKEDVRSAVYAGIVAAVLYAALSRRRWNLPRFQGRGADATVVLASAIFALAAPLKVAQADAAAIAHGRWGWLTARIEELPAGARIAGAEIGTKDRYRVTGRRFQHRPVDVDRDGVKKPPIHLKGSHQRPPDRGFVQNLLASGVEYVAVKARAGAWPRQHLLLSEAPEACLFAHREHHGALWALGSRCQSRHGPSSGAVPDHDLVGRQEAR